MVSIPIKVEIELSEDCKRLLRYIEKQKAKEAVTKCNQLPVPESIEVQIGNQFFEYKYHSAKGGYVSEPKPCKTCGGTGVYTSTQVVNPRECIINSTPCPDCKREGNSTRRMEIVEQLHALAKEYESLDRAFSVKIEFRIKG